MTGIIFSSKYIEWRTPQKFFDRLNEEFHFVLDAAATYRNTKCKLYYSIYPDALTQSWNHGGAVFCNPPYGRNIGKWVQKAYEESQSGVTIVMLLPARTDTQWFHNWVYGKAEIRFIKGRIKFEDEEGKKLWNAPFPSMIVIYDSNMEQKDG